MDTPLARFSKLKLSVLAHHLLIGVAVLPMFGDSTTFGQIPTESVGVATTSREIASFDRTWKFDLGDAPDADKPDFDDSNWRTLDIPHDWMIEGVPGADPSTMDGPFDKNSPGGGGSAFLNGGVGWYRKTFTLPSSSEDKRVIILFDGAYMNSQAWLNGKLLGERPYGYSSFYYDLTTDAHFGGQKNVLAVRLNVEQPCSRWYSGAGLYRNVWLITTQRVHVAQWGTYITTPRVATTGADILVKTQVQNDDTKPTNVSLTTRILDPDGKEVGRQESTQKVAAHNAASFEQTIALSTAKLWSPDSPMLYQAINEVRVHDALTDSATTSFGIRTIEFNREKGFILNGQRLQIKGVCDHHDLGCLGAVALSRGYERQLQILKSMGCNAVRTSHNPPAPELLDLCDKMGFLVMDEAFDEWKLGKVKLGYAKFFDQWSDQDIRTMVDRDRNHPSIILWSIGNEIHEGYKEIPGFASAISQRLVADCHQEDPSRPATSACPWPSKAWVSGLAPALDVFGINYSVYFYRQTDPSHIQIETAKPGDYHAEKPVVGSETASAISSRGEYGLTLDAKGNVQMNADLKNQISEYGDYPVKFANRAERSLIAIKNSPWFAGEFVWTGFDYLGEPAPYPWPARSSYYGIVDLCGFPKDRFFLYQAMWGDKPAVHIMPHWTWPGFEGKAIPVWVYTNADSVELFLNGHSLGAKHFPTDDENVLSPIGVHGNPTGTKDKTVKTEEMFSEKLDPSGKKEQSLHLAWSVPYAPGILKAVATKNGQVVATDEVRTTGVPSSINLTPDRTQIVANGQDLSYIKVTILDKDGNVCPDGDNEIAFTFKGASASLAGLDDGDPTNHESFQGTQHKVFHGLGLAVLKSHYDTTGPVTLTASSPGLPSVTTTVKVIPP